MDEKVRLSLRPGTVITHKAEGKGKIRDYDEQLKNLSPEHVAVQVETQEKGVYRNVFWHRENVETLS